MFSIKKNWSLISILDEIDKLFIHIFNLNDLQKLIQFSISKNYKLNLKLGFDPTGGNLHLGHIVLLEKSKKLLMILNARIDIIIGDVTILSNSPDRQFKNIALDKIEENISSLIKQICFILKGFDFVIHRNSNFFKDLNVIELIPILHRFDVKTILDKFKISNISLGSAIYPALQGYDSKFLFTDIELGGTDQTVNLLAGRELCNQVCLISELMPSIDGKKMSKSFSDSAIFINQNPSKMFRQLMKLSDELFFLFAKNLGLNFNFDLTLSNINQEKIKLAKIIVERFCFYENQSNFISLKDSKNLSSIEISNFSLEQSISLVSFLSLNLGFSRKFVFNVMKQKGIKVNNEICLKDIVLLVGEKYIISFGKYYSFCLT